MSASSSTGRVTPSVDMGAGTYSVLIVHDSPFASRHPRATISHKRAAYAALLIGRDFPLIPGTALQGSNPGLRSSAEPSVVSLRSQKHFLGAESPVSRRNTTTQPTQSSPTPGLT